MKRLSALFLSFLILMPCSSVLADTYTVDEVLPSIPSPCSVYSIIGSRFCDFWNLPLKNGSQ